MSIPPDINDSLIDSANKAANGSDIIHRVGNEPEGSYIDTLSGPVPSIKEWYAQQAVRIDEDVADSIESVSEQAQAAEASAELSQSAASMAAAFINPSADTAEGLGKTSGAGTTNRYFTVLVAGSPTLFTLYRNDAGVAANIGQAPSVLAVKAIAPKRMPLGPLKSPLSVAIGGKLVLSFDKNGKLITDHTHTEITSLADSIAAVQAQTPKKLPMGPLRIRFAIAVGNKLVSGSSDDGTTYPIQSGGGSAGAVTVAEKVNVEAASLVAAQPILMKDPAYTIALLIHKIVVGQSNAFGRGAFVLDPSAAYEVMGTTASPVKGDVFSGADSAYGDYCLTMFSTDTVDFRGLKALLSVNTDGSGNITGSGETLLPGWANSFQKWLRDGHYLPQRMVATVHAIGGTKYLLMKKGTPTYDDALLRVTRAKAIAATKGWNYEVQSISIVHGEAEGSDTTQAMYEGYLLEWWSDYNTDFKVITGQKRDIAAFLIGVSSFTSSNQQIALAQLAACEKYPALIYVCPSYMFPYGDEVHRLAKGNFKHGEYEMRAERFWIAGKKWNLLKPKSITRVDNVVTVQFNNTVYGTSETPGPVGALTLDTTNVTNPGNYGFRVADSTTNIVSVALGSDGSSVVLTLSATPEPGARIEYAMQYDLRNTGAPADPYIRFPTAGARGNVRDSDARDLSAFDSAPLYNWLVPFRQVIG